MEVEWDEQKNQINQNKHRLGFEEAAEIFRYPMYEMVDPRTYYNFSTTSHEKGANTLP